MTPNDSYLAIDAVWRIESAKLVAALTRMTQDVGLAEDFAQEALVAALQQWPDSGIPPKPGAWLMATAKHRAVDYFRRGQMLERKHQELGQKREESESTVPDFESAMDDYIEDDVLRLIFIACHPVLSIDSQGPCDYSAVSRPRRSHGPFLLARPRLPRGSFAPRRPLATPRYPLKFLVGQNSRLG